MTKKLRFKSRGLAGLARMYDRAPKAKTRVPRLLKKILNPKGKGITGR